jgi:hypothetical protein
VVQIAFIVAGERVLYIDVAPVLETLGIEIREEGQDRLAECVAKSVVLGNETLLERLPVNLVCKVYALAI